MTDFISTYLDEYERAWSLSAQGILFPSDAMRCSDATASPAPFKAGGARRGEARHGFLDEYGLSTATIGIISFFCPSTWRRKTGEVKRLEGVSKEPPRNEAGGRRWWW